MTNIEGGTMREEYRVAAVKDRISTTAEVWMGLTMQCAQCHSHKFDPITQKDYYQFFAIFNQTEDNDRPDEAPTMPLATPEEQAKQAALKAEIAALEKKMKETHAGAGGRAARVGGEHGAADRLDDARAAECEDDRRDLARAAAGPLAAGDRRRRPGATTYSVTARSPLRRITAFRLELLPDDELPMRGPGRAANGNAVVTEFRAEEVRSEQARAGGALRARGGARARAHSLARGGAGLSRAGKHRARGQGDAVEHGVRRRRGAGDRRQDQTAISTRANRCRTPEESSDPWWEVDLGSAQPVSRIVVWNRTDRRGCRRGSGIPACCCWMPRASR